jgi:predicted metalloprotease with PDZ domain
MTASKELCPQSFKVWLAFLMGMVLIVISIVVFDKVLRDGRLGFADSHREEDMSARPSAATGVVLGSNIAQPVSYLSLKDEFGSGSWLGIEAVDLTESTAKALGYDIDGGALIRKIFDRSPSENAGLMLGDIIVELDYRDIDCVDTLSRLLDELDPGMRVKVVFYREGDREVTYLKLGDAVEAPVESERQGVADGSGATRDQRWGIVVSGLTDALREAYGIDRKEKGVVVLMVVAGSAADRAGIRRGDLIEQVDRTSVRDLSDFFEAIQTPANHVLLKVYRDDTVLYVHVTSVAPLVPVSSVSYADDTDLSVKETGRPLSTPSPNRPDLIGSRDTEAPTGTQKSTGTRQSLLGIPAEILPESIVRIVSGWIGGEESVDGPPVFQRVQNPEALL